MVTKYIQAHLKRNETIGETFNFCDHKISLDTMCVVKNI